MYADLKDASSYRAAFYIRLSKEDEGETESQSVTNQRSLLQNFAAQNHLDVYAEYVDDGFSGTNFDRPAFLRMLSDIEAKKVNLVITKDLSRLGRDYILTGHYMERYFPENGVRYISILDGIDTGIDSTANDITPFRAIMNDMYAKDISKKIKSVKHDKQRKGLFIGGKAVYGYLLSTEEKNKIVIDEEAADVVRQIFAYAAEGRSCREIATLLNENRIPPPAVYANLPVARKGPYSGLWSSERVSDMLQNQTYIGNMVQGKSKKISYKSKKCVKLQRKDWIVVEKTHEPIIDEATFCKVQELLASRKTTRKRTYDYALKGIAFCHECGYPLAVINRPNAAGEDVLYFVCRTYQRFTKARACTCHSIQVDKVTGAVFRQLEALCKDVWQEEQMIEAGVAALEAMENQKTEVGEAQRLKTKIASLSASMDRVYLDKLSGVLQEEDFYRIYCRLKEERDVLHQKYSKIQAADLSPSQKIEQVRKLACKFYETKNDNREFLLSMIKKVELTEEKEIIIHFRCMEPTETKPLTVTDANSIAH